MVWCMVWYHGMVHRAECAHLKVLHQQLGGGALHRLHSGLTHLSAVGQQSASSQASNGHVRTHLTTTPFSPSNPWKPRFLETHSKATIELKDVKEHCIWVWVLSNM